MNSTKVILLTITCLAFSVKSLAQAATENTIEVACNCLNKIDDATKQDPIGTETAVRDCITKAMLDNLYGLMEDFGLKNPNDAEAMQGMAGKLSESLTQRCPISIALLNGDAGNTPPPAYMMLGKTKGTLVLDDVANNGAVIVIHTANNENLTFYHVRHFKGEELLKDINNLAGKTIEIDWATYENFDPSTNDYKVLHEIRALNIITQ